MSADVIKEFLVSLGYRVDERGQTSMVNGLRFVATTATAAAGLVVAATAAMARGLEQLYFVSQRTHATVQSLQSISFAASQMGLSVESGTQAIEALSSYLRASPGGANMLRSIGVSTQEANGQLRDMGAILLSLGERLAQMPEWQSRAYGNAIGLDERFVLALRNPNYLRNMREYNDMLRETGMSSAQAASDAQSFMERLRSLMAAFGLLRQYAGAQIFRSMGTDIDRFRRSIIENFDQITAVIVALARAFLFAVETIARLSVVLIGIIRDIALWFGRLDAPIQNFILALGGILIAWRLLNTAFMRSPLGIILSLAAGLLLLYEDYQVWRDGGQSLIDWEKWEPAITATIEAIEAIGRGIRSMIEWFNSLDSDTRRTTLAIGGLTAAWLALSRAFMLTPIGRILAAIAGLGAIASILTGQAPVDEPDHAGARRRHFHDEEGWPLTVEEPAQVPWWRRLFGATPTAPATLPRPQYGPPLPPEMRRPAAQQGRYGEHSRPWDDELQALIARGATEAEFQEFSRRRAAAIGQPAHNPSRPRPNSFDGLAPGQRWDDGIAPPRGTIGPIRPQSWFGDSDAASRALHAIDRGVGRGYGTPTGGGNRNISLHQEVNITISGARDPAAVAAEVGRRQDSSAQDIIRHLGTQAI